MDTCVVKLCTNLVNHNDDTGVCAECQRKIADRHTRRILALDGASRNKSYLARVDKKKANQERDSARALWAEFEQPDGTSFVYYVQIGEHIKIGYTTRVLGRLSALRVTVDDLLALEPGGYAEEQRRHAQFSHLRITQRWENFRPEPDLLAHIEQLKIEHGLPRWLRAPRRRGRNGPIAVRRTGD